MSRPISLYRFRHADVCADASLREVGLNLAVATMRKGERCHLKVQPQYGYGDRGDSPPSQDFTVCRVSKPPETPLGLEDIIGSRWVPLGNHHCCQAPYLLNDNVGACMVFLITHMQAAFHSQMCHRALSWSMIWSSLILTLPMRYYAIQMRVSSPCSCTSHAKTWSPLAVKPTPPLCEQRVQLSFERCFMLSLVGVAQLKDRGQMTYEERLEAAERHRMTGNTLFQQVVACCSKLSESSCGVPKCLWRVRCEMRHTSTTSRCAVHACCMLCGAEASAGSCFRNVLNSRASAPDGR